MESKYYYTLDNPAGYASIQKLYNAVKKQKNNVTEKDITRWLKSQDTYTLHRISRKNYPRNPVIVVYIDEQWVTDLIDVSKIKKQNDKFTYLLTVVDCLSKYAWVEPLKDKSGESTVKAFTKIFSESGRKPEKLQSDKGTEYTSVKFQKFLKDHGVKHFTVASDMKAIMAERFNRTLKDKLWKYFSNHNTFRYVDVIQDIVQTYNNTTHSATKMKPIKVTTETTKHVLRNLYRKKLWSKDRIPKYKFEKGSLVRVSNSKAPFTKGYLGRWSEEVFKVVKRYPRMRPVYKLEDLNGDPVAGTWYHEELQEVYIPSDKLYTIEKIIRKKKIDGNMMYLVKWRGYSDKFNSWVGVSEVEKKKKKKKKK